MFKSIARRFAVVLILFASALAGQQVNNFNREVESNRARYTKYDYHIPMRDGVKLFTLVYVPKDGS